MDLETADRPEVAGLREPIENQFFACRPNIAVETLATCVDPRQHGVVDLYAVSHLDLDRIGLVSNLSSFVAAAYEPH
jgi:hypothetical protein